MQKNTGTYRKSNHSEICPLPGNGLSIHLFSGVLHSTHIAARSFHNMVDRVRHSPPGGWPTLSPLRSQLEGAHR
jgi:hypothetical protein